MSFAGIIIHRPVVNTFDSGYEHSLEHLLDLKEMLAEEMEENSSSAVAETSVAAAMSAA